jgi:hypothetical protein
LLGLRPATNEMRMPGGPVLAVPQTEYEIRVLEDGSTLVTLFSGKATFSNAGVSLTMTLNSNRVLVARPGRPPESPADLEATNVVRLEAANVVRWWIAHPAVLDVHELDLDAESCAALARSLEAYAAGQLREALLLAPTNRVPSSPGERAYAAALRLVINDVTGAENLLADARWDDLAAAALHLLIDAIHNPTSHSPSLPSGASGWLAHSYWQQAQHRLQEALADARKATDVSPKFLAAWLRIAELELGRGDFRAARNALDQARPLGPRSSRLALLEGFLALAENRTSPAEEAFDRAIAVDASQADGWFGRGLVHLRQHRRAEGQADLITAVALEPERAELRGQLGKVFALEGRWAEAEFQLARARELDARDPTPWLYTAILDREQNRLNPAITNLAESVRLNDNRALFRGRSQLDQDEAIRRANIAALYREAGLLEWSRWEAARAVSVDYASADTHQFLAQSYAALTDPFRATLRYETAAAAEFLIASLLAPVGSVQLSPITAFSQPMEFFSGRSLEFYSEVTARSPGGVTAAFSQQGHIDRTAWALDYSFADLDRGATNTDVRQHVGSLALKQQIGISDSAYLFVQGTTAEGGDTRPYYLPDAADPTFRYEEDQWPNVLLGWHHQWSPEHQTLALGGLLNDDFVYAADAQSVLLLDSPFRSPTNLWFAPHYKNRFQLWSVEVQHLVRHPGGELQVGGRYQTGDLDTHARLDLLPNQANGVFAKPASDQNTTASMQRLALYLYDTLHVFEPLSLELGVTYDKLKYPANVTAPPLDPTEREEDAVSPKVGLLWTPFSGTAVRAAYTRSLGGFSFDSSVRLEPTQVLGFLQAYRSLIPESEAGIIPGATTETLGCSLSQVVRDRVYATLVVEELRSTGSRQFGVFRFEPPASPVATQTEELDFRETLVNTSVNALVGRDFTFAARYNLAWTRLDRGIPELASFGPPFEMASYEVRTHLFNLSGIWRHPSGFFAELGNTWIWQHNTGADAAGDEAVSHLDAVVGFRFPRRQAALSLGVLNLTDEDYRLNPLGFQAFLPRERTYVISASFNVW